MKVTYELLTSSKFTRELEKFVKNDKSRAKAVKKALNLLINNPLSPGLNIEKITTEIWTIRIDKGNRIFFTFVDKRAILLIDIGKHDKYRVH